MNDMSNTDSNFDPEIKVIEADIINFLVDGMTKYSGRDPIFAKLISYFFTRQQLTQKELQILTGLSAGTISQTLRQFEEQKLIKMDFKKGKEYGKIYIMNGISFGKPEYLRNLEKKNNEHITKLEKIKAILEKNKEALQNLDNFNKIYSLTTELLFLLKSLPERLSTFYDDLQNSLKKVN